MNKKLSIIIITFNSGKYVKNLFDSLKLQTYDFFDIIVVDNNSDDDCLSLIKEYEGTLSISYIKNISNIGFSKANNKGIVLALDRGSDSVLLLNHDTILEKNTIEESMKYLFSNKSIGAIVPTILYRKPNEKYIWRVGTNFRSIKEAWNEKTIKPSYHLYKNENYLAHSNLVSREVDALTGCAMFVKKEVIEKVGMLDERFFMYFEDTDWSLRIRYGGYTLYHFSGTKVFHNTPMRNVVKKYYFIKNMKKIYRYIYSLMFFLLKNKICYKK